MRVKGGEERARRIVAPRFAIPRAWPNVAVLAIAVGAALVTTESLVLRVAGGAALALGAFHIGSIGSPDPNANHRANVAERALLTLGLSVRPSGTGRPAGAPDTGSDPDEPVKVTPRTIKRKPLRAARALGPARPGGYRVATGEGAGYPADGGPVPFGGEV